MRLTLAASGVFVVVSFAAPAPFAATSRADWTIHSAHRFLEAGGVTRESSAIESGLLLIYDGALSPSATQQAGLGDIGISARSNLHTTPLPGDARATFVAEFEVHTPTPVHASYELLDGGLFRLEGPSHAMTATSGRAFFPELLLAPGNYRAELAITLEAGPSGRSATAHFDVAHFVIPEPSTAALAALCALCALCASVVYSIRRRRLRLLPHDAVVSAGQ